MIRIVILVLALFIGTSTAEAQTLYWSDDARGAIHRAPVDSLEIKTIVKTGGPRIIGLEVDPTGGKVYWTTWDEYLKGRKIQRANLDGSNVEDLVTTMVDGVAGIAIDGVAKKMYWVDYSSKSIKRANLELKNGEAPHSRSDVEEIVTADLENPLFITLDLKSKKMYWTDREKIQRADLDGSSIETLVEGRASLRGIALDVAAGKMYWADSTARKIQRSNLDGTGVEDLVVDGQDGPSGVTLDLKKGKIYWADNFCCKERRGQIMRADLDGSNVEIVVGRGRVVPYSIVLDPESKPAP